MPRSSLEHPVHPPDPEGLPVREGRTPKGLAALSQVGSTSLYSCGVFAHNGEGTLLFLDLISWV